MKVLLGVDPHKASVAVAVVDEVVGESWSSVLPSHKTAPA